MLIASRRTTVGAMKSQAIERSDNPLARRAIQSGDAEATRAASEGTGVISVIAVMVVGRISTAEALRRRRIAGGPRAPNLLLAVVLEDLLPVLDERIERLLRRAFVGDDVVVDALLLGQQELGVGRLGPEVDDLAHRLEEVGGERCGFGKAGIVQHRLVGGIAAERPPFLLHVRLGEPLDVGERVSLIW